MYLWPLAGSWCAARLRAAALLGWKRQRAGRLGHGYVTSWRAAPFVSAPGVQLRRASVAVVFVVAAEPQPGLVPAEWGPVEPLVHAPEAVQPARVRRVSVVHDTIVEGERAHARRFPAVRRPVRAHG